jgi:hypothetical protein
MNYRSRRRGRGRTPSEPPSALSWRASRRTWMCGPPRPRSTPCPPRPPKVRSFWMLSTFSEERVTGRVLDDATLEVDLWSACFLISCSTACRTRLGAEQCCACCCRGHGSQGAPGAFGDLAGGGAVGSSGDGAAASVKGRLPRQGSSGLATQGGSRQHRARAAASRLASQPAAAAVAGPWCGLLGFWRPRAPAEPRRRRCICSCGCALPAGDAAAAEAAGWRPPHAGGATVSESSLVVRCSDQQVRTSRCAGRAGSCWVSIIPLPFKSLQPSAYSLSAGSSSLGSQQPGRVAPRLCDQTALSVRQPRKPRLAATAGGTACWPASKVTCWQPSALRFDAITACMA